MSGLAGAQPLKTYFSIMGTRLNFRVYRRVRSTINDGKKYILLAKDSGKMTQGHKEPFFLGKTLNLFVGPVTTYVFRLLHMCVMKLGLPDILRLTYLTDC